MCLRCFIGFNALQLSLFLRVCGFACVLLLLLMVLLFSYLTKNNCLRRWKDNRFKDGLSINFLTIGMYPVLKIDGMFTTSNELPFWLAYLCTCTWIEVRNYKFNVLRGCMVWFGFLRGSYSRTLYGMCFVLPLSFMIICAISRGKRDTVLSPVNAEEDKTLYI